MSSISRDKDGLVFDEEDLHTGETGSCVFTFLVAHTSIEADRRDRDSQITDSRINPPSPLIEHRVPLRLDGGA
jgi:hypothetical protein